MKYVAITSVLQVALAAATVSADENSNVTFAQDGKDLIVSTTVTVNNSSHVLWMHSIDVGKNVTLYYYVFQNRDLLVRSKKQLKIEWRLANIKQEGKEFQIVEKFLPNTAEIRTLLPQLQELAEEGATRKLTRSSEHTVAASRAGAQLVEQF